VTNTYSFEEVFYNNLFEPADLFSIGTIYSRYLGRRYVLEISEKLMFDQWLSVGIKDLCCQCYQTTLLTVL
jgi:hypothetical protein